MEKANIFNQEEIFSNAYGLMVKFQPLLISE